VAPRALPCADPDRTLRPLPSSPAVDAVDEGGAGSAASRPWPARRPPGRQCRTAAAPPPWQGCANATASRRPCRRRTSPRSLRIHDLAAMAPVGPW